MGQGFLFDSSSIFYAHLIVFPVYERGLNCTLRVLQS